MLPIQASRMDQFGILPKVSIIFTVMVFFIPTATSNKFGSTSVHKTKEAQETKPDLFCYTCDMMTDDDNCVNINKTRQLNLTKKCDADQSFCVVSRFSYTMSDKNSTSDKKLWTLQRNCTDKCESGCIVIGERVKLYACSSCCSSSFCNISSGSDERQRRSYIFSTLFSILLVYTSKHS